MAITAKRTWETKGTCVQLSGKLAASLTAYQGQLVVLDGGFFNSPTDAANKIPIGVLQWADGMVDGKIINGAVATTDAIVEKGLIWVPFTNAAQTDVGLLFFLDDNGTVSKTSSSKTWKVVCEGFKTGYVLLNFDKLLGAAA